MKLFISLKNKNFHFSLKKKIPKINKIIQKQKFLCLFSKKGIYIQSLKGLIF